MGKKPNFHTMNYAARRKQLDTCDRKIQLNRIYERDQGICQVCNLPCTREDASRGHIKDLMLCTKREATSDDNMQLEHKICNNVKAQQPKKYSATHQDSTENGLTSTIFDLMPDFPWQQWTEDNTNGSD